MKVFEDGVPTAHVVRLRGVDHYVYLSNEADVLREMKSFLSTLGVESKTFRIDRSAWPGGPPKKPRPWVKEIPILD